MRLYSILSKFIYCVKLVVSEKAIQILNFVCLTLLNIDPVKNLFNVMRGNTEYLLNYK